MIGPPDLSDGFFGAWVDMCDRLNIDPIDLIRVSYSEAGCRATAHNPNGNASGLIQFMPGTLLGLGWTKGHDEFRELDAAAQVPWVERYMAEHASWCRSDALCYVAVFLPALGHKALTTGPEYVLCGANGPLSWAYKANRVLDRLKASGAQGADGIITVADLARQLTVQCQGARWDAILWRLRQTMGLQPPAIPPPPDTQPEAIPLVNTPIMDSRFPPNAASQPTIHPDPSVYLRNHVPSDDDDAA